MNSKRKAQFFVLSSFFVVTILFFFSRWTAPLTIIDTSAVIFQDETFIFNNIMDSLNDTVHTASSCEDLNYTIQEYTDFVRKFGGTRGLNLVVNSSIYSCVLPLGAVYCTNITSPNTNLFGCFNSHPSCRTDLWPDSVYDYFDNDYFPGCTPCPGPGCDCYPLNPDKASGPVNPNPYVNSDDIAFVQFNDWIILDMGDPIIAQPGADFFYSEGTSKFDPVKVYVGNDPTAPIGDPAWLLALEQPGPADCRDESDPNPINLCSDLGIFPTVGRFAVSDFSDDGSIYRYVLVVDNKNPSDIEFDGIQIACPDVLNFNKPVFNSITVPASVIVGDDLDITTDANDFADGDNVKLVVCSHPGAFSSGCTSTDPNLIEFCNTGFISQDPSCSYTTTTPNTFNYYAYIFDGTGFPSDNSPKTGTFIVTPPGGPSNLVLHLNFDEGSGDTLTDLSGNGNDGTLFGGLDLTGWTTTDCYSGSCLVFDGSDDYVTILNSPSLDITSDLTISAWIKSEPISGVRGIVTKITNSQEKQYALSKVGTQLRLDYEVANNNYLRTETTLTNTLTHHIAVTIDSSGENRLFIDGAEVGLPETSTETLSSSDPVTIGRWSGTFNGGYFMGKIDEVRIYNRVLSDAEIATLAT